MTAVSNASPLITLARVGRLESLQEIFETVVISREVYEEVVTSGAGMPGALAVSRADWITVSAIQDSGAMASALIARRLGAGETSAVLLAKELGVSVVLMDELRGRRFATESGLAVVGCIGIFEELYRRGLLVDLRQI